MCEAIVFLIKGFKSYFYFVFAFAYLKAHNDIQTSYHLTHLRSQILS